MHLSNLKNNSGLENKRIAIWGMGREGKTTLSFLKKIFPKKDFIIINQDEVETDETFILESEMLRSLDRFDVIIKSPGISYYLGAVKAMLDHDIIVTSATNIWFALPKPGKVIAITGSNGKSTTSALTHHILTTLGLNAELGGNIGTPLLSLPLDADYYVVELSSYQTCDLTGTPDIAVLLNLHPEHIQWHKTHKQYYHDKCNLLRRGAPINIVNHNEPRTMIDGSIPFNDPDKIHFKGKMIYDGETVLGTADNHPLIGDHNLENICATLSICKELGLDLKACLKASFGYQGLPHRLHIFGPINGITYINDSISTDPEATIAAINALPGEDITLIVGGEDREQNYDALSTLIGNNNVKAICVYETGPRIYDQINSSDKYQAADLADAVKKANEITPNGGYIVMSPAAPSYDAFKDFEERGGLFMKLVKT